MLIAHAFYGALQFLAPRRIARVEVLDVLLDLAADRGMAILDVGDRLFKRVLLRGLVLFQALDGTVDRFAFHMHGRFDHMHAIVDDADALAKHGGAVRRLLMGLAHLVDDGFERAG